eukprot:4598481-Amphidinium_carterae.1
MLLAACSQVLKRVEGDCRECVGALESRSGLQHLWSYCTPKVTTQVDTGQGAEWDCETAEIGKLTKQQTRAQRRGIARNDT